MEILTDSASYRVVMVTCSTVEEAKALSVSVVQEKLAACVNIVPGIYSVYWWENRIQQDSECLLIIKTRSEKLQALADCIAKGHSYTVPEFIVLPIEAGSERYLSWLRENTP